MNDTCSDNWGTDSSLYINVHCANNHVRNCMFITPHVWDMSGVIVLTSSVGVCASVTTPTTERTDIPGHTDLNFGMEVKWKDI